MIIINKVKNTQHTEGNSFNKANTYVTLFVLLLFI